MTMEIASKLEFLESYTRSLPLQASRIAECCFTPLRKFWNTRTWRTSRHYASSLHSSYIRMCSL